MASLLMPAPFLVSAYGPVSSVLLAQSIFKSARFAIVQTLHTHLDARFMLIWRLIGIVLVLIHHYCAFSVYHGVSPLSEDIAVQLTQQV